MDFRVLGPLEIRDGDRRIELRRQKQKALLVTLLLNAGELVSTDRLVDSLWGESPPPRAVGSLQNLVSELRKELGANLIRTRAPGYVLDVGRDAVDAHRFVRLVAEARDVHDPATRRTLLRDALGLWRGDALADIALEPFAAVEIARLEEHRLSAREELADAELRLGRHADVLVEVEALVAEQPFRERPRALLMLALYRSGRQAEALEAFQQARRFLRDELGLDPSAGLKALQQAILRQDPALDAPAATLAGVAGEERRKTVTVVFADLVDSTGLGAELDAEAYREVLRHWYRTARTALEAHGGVVEKFIGDAVVGLFGVPERHEDDALRAVRAALEMQAGVAKLNDDLRRSHGVAIRTRVGVNTGEAITGDVGSGAPATGYAVNVAAKLQQKAPPDAVVVAAATYTLVRDALSAEQAEPLVLGSRSVPTFRVVSLAPRAPTIRRDPGPPIVGREKELAALREEWAAVRDSRTSRVVTIVGEAGIGKSRLAAELASEVRGEAIVLVGRCVSYGDGATYLPIEDVVRDLVPDGSETGIAALLGDDPDATLVARRLRELLGWTDRVEAAGEGLWAVRRLLHSLARGRPVLLVLDDVHWAEPTLLALVEQLAAAPFDAPALVLCLAREDLRAARPDWPVLLTLRPLLDAQTAELVANLARAGELPAALRRRVVETAEGNALFAEQLIRYVAEEGERALDEVPTTLEALLASRLDRLPEAELAVLERAAVVGREFWRGAVAELSERPIDDELAALTAKGLLRAARSAIPGEEALHFNHVLIRDVAYAGITKARRTRAHERVAGWLDVRNAGSDEIVGYHLEQAYRYRVEVGPRDDDAARLAREAGARLETAGTRALMRGDAPASSNLIDRAVALLDETDPRRLELLCELAISLRTMGDLDRALDVLHEAKAGAAAIGDERVRLRAEIELLNIASVTDPAIATSELLELARSAVPVFEAHADDRSLGRAWILIGDADGGMHGHMGAWAEAAERALEHYERLGWPPITPIAKLAAALYHGPEPVPSALRRCDELLRRGEGMLYAEASVLVVMGGLRAQRREFDEGRRLIAEGTARYAEIGQTLLVTTFCQPVLGTLELLAGDVAAAEAAFRAACEDGDRLGESAHLATQVMRLAETVYLQERLDEAESLIALGAARAASDDVLAQALWRAVSAKINSARGLDQKADELSQEAVALLAESDGLNYRAATVVDRGIVLRDTGRSQEAAAAFGAAATLYRRKANVAALDNLRRLREQLALV